MSLGIKDLLGESTVGPGGPSRVPVIGRYSKRPLGREKGYVSEGVIRSQSGDVMFCLVIYTRLDGT